jgi:hypothetical protein
MADIDNDSINELEVGVIGGGSMGGVRTGGPPARLPAPAAHLGWLLSIKEHQANLAGLAPDPSRA